MNKAKQFIKDCTKTCSNEIVAKEPCFHEWVTPEQALKAVETAEEEWLSKACEWLKENSQKYVYWMDEEFGKEDLIEDFKKYFKNE